MWHKTKFSQYIAPETFSSVSKVDLRLIRALDDLNPKKVVAALKAGANIEFRDKHQRTPLHYAVVQDEKIAQVLLENGADTDAQDAHYETPMHVAVHANAKKAVHMLLYYNADACQVNRFNWTPFTVALMMANNELQKLLLPYESDFNRVDQFGRSMLTLAMECASNELTEMMNRGAVFCLTKSSTREDFVSVKTFQRVWSTIDYMEMPKLKKEIISQYRLPEILVYVAGTDLLPCVLDDMHEMRIRGILKGTEPRNNRNTGLINMLLSHFCKGKAVELIYIFTSYGYNPTYREAEIVFSKCGRSDVYHFVAQLDLIESGMDRDFLLPNVTFDVSKSVKYQIKEFVRSKVRSENSLHYMYTNVSSIMQFFTTDYCVRILDHFEECGGVLDRQLMEKMGMNKALHRKVRSLQEITRDFVRDRICRIHELYSFSLYRRMVYTLRVGRFADILLYKQPVYQVNEEWLSHIKDALYKYFGDHAVLLPLKFAHLFA